MKSLRRTSRPAASRILATSLACAGLALAVAGARAEDLTGKVMTVSGPIDPAALGMTLPHEHLLISFVPPRETPEAWRAIGEEPPSDQAFLNAPLTMDKIGAALMGKFNRDNRVLDDEALAVREATDYRWIGGRSVVDVTPNGIGRNPEALKRIADATGLHVVMGSGWYERGYVGDALDGRSAESLADEIVRDITVGVGGSGIRSGVIGEVGLQQVQRAYERKLIAAAVQASQRTGAAISLHFSRGHHEQLAAIEELKKAGADMTRVAFGHSNPVAQELPLLKAILEQGSYVQFDLLGDAPHILSEMPDHDVAVTIVELVRQGYGKQILLSQDVCTKTDLKAFGGSGYSFVAEQYIPYLRRLGVTEEQVGELVVGNPRRLLTFAAPRGARR